MLKFSTKLAVRVLLATMVGEKARLVVPRGLMIWAPVSQSSTYSEKLMILFWEKHAEASQWRREKRRAAAVSSMPAR